MVLYVHLRTTCLIAICFVFMVCPWIGSGELLDDLKKHGCHDVYWCYAFEREVSQVVNIAANQLNSEVTYNNYYARLCFTMVHKVVHIDHDGLS